MLIRCHCWPLFLLVALLSQGCASSRYFGQGKPPQSPESVGFSQRLESKTQGDVTVSVAVLNATESEAVFGVPMADQGIQPVWQAGHIDPQRGPPSPVRSGTTRVGLSLDAP